jgi:hypothetical protein
VIRVLQRALSSNFFWNDSSNSKQSHRPAAGEHNGDRTAFDAEVGVITPAEDDRI